MAEDQEQVQSKTEAPTPRKREEARKKGQVAYSSDLASGFILLVGVGVFWLGGSAVGQNLLETIRQSLEQIGRKQLDSKIATAMAASFLHSLLQITGLILGVISLAAFAVGVLQSGLRLSTDPLQLNWSRLSPIKGWSRIWSQRSAMRAVMAVIKVVALGAVAWWIVCCQVNLISSSGRGSLAMAVSSGWHITIQIALAASAGLVLLGMLDYLFQRWRHEQDLKMSRREIKEEQKQEEGDPHVKARVKRLQREAAQRRMLSDVPNATVIVTNPTHVAVALQYDQATMPAPKVVAKGADLLAKRITKIAEEHQIPVLQRPPLARALYGAVETGQEIPPELYRALAEILAYVFRLRGIDSR
jgi:flagellar biosynthetic protein FlhB